ncbi:glycosyltransferase family 2 protein [bacterium]|nr:MAG: glycosyltransferase family 2 protein [bacterium]
MGESIFGSAEEKYNRLAMLLSIIVATKGRLKEVEDLIYSIKYSNYKLIEVIIVDQNVSDGLTKLLADYNGELAIKHIKVEARGASNARNIGIQQSVGQYFCFPDDDCKFMENTIDVALHKIQHYDVIFGKCVDETGKDSVINFAKGDHNLTLQHHENMFVEATMFARKEIMLNYSYDENLGVGTFHGAEEAYDLILRLLNAGKNLAYSEDIIFYHPNKILNHSSQGEIRRVFSYRCGFAKLCFKHKFYKKYFTRLFLVLFAIPYFLIADRKKCRYYLSEFLGLIVGAIIP